MPRGGPIGVEIDFFIFETSPQPFHEHVVAPTPDSIHADLNVMRFQEPRKLLARKLAALIRIEDLWAAMPGNRFLHRVHTEVHRQRIGQPPRQHSATRPVKIAHRYRKPRCIGIYVTSATHT